MKRRQFLKLASLAGMSSTLPLYPEMSAFAADDGYTGPLWIMVNAAGGWDPTSLCDPKGYDGVANNNNPDRVNNYDKNAIQQVGNIPYAPPPDSFLTGGAFFDANLYSSQQFFEKYFQDLLVINGIDTMTNSHSNGQLITWSGSSRKGYPAFAALVAGVLAGTRPLSYITNGGYSYPADLIVPARMDSRGINALYEIAFPNRSSSPSSANSRVYFEAAINDLISQANIERSQRLRSQQLLPRLQASLDKFIAAGSDTGHLQDLADLLAANPERPQSDFNGRNNAFKLYQQGRLAIAGYEAGTTACVNINIGGFDTHSNHDERHYPRLMDLLQGIDAIIEEANARGLRDKIVLVVGSEFGRTNKYNKDNGKDHWPITSMMMIGNSTQIIRGNRVVGATNDIHKTVNLDPITLVPDVDGNNANSVRLTPTHVHRELRRLSTVDASGHATRFPLDAEDLAIL